MEEKGLGKQVMTKGLGSPMTKGTGMRSKASGTGEVEMIREGLTPGGKREPVTLRFSLVREVGAT